MKPIGINDQYIIEEDIQSFGIRSGEVNRRQLFLNTNPCVLNNLELDDQNLQINSMMEDIHKNEASNLVRIEGSQTCSSCVLQTISKRGKVDQGLNDMGVHNQDVDSNQTSFRFDQSPKNSVVRQLETKTQGLLDQGQFVNNQIPSDIDNKIEIKNNEIKENLNPKTGTSKVWLKGFFVIVCFLGKFKYHLKKQLIFRNPDLLKQNQLMVIGDKGAKSTDELNGNNLTVQKSKHMNKSRFKIVRLFIKRLKNIRKKCKVIWIPIRNMIILFNQFLKDAFNKLSFPLFDPVNHLVMAWDMLNIGLIFIYTIYATFNIAFGDYISSEIFEIIIKCVFILNVLVQCNLAFYEKGIKITSRSSVIDNFLKKLFLTELLSIIAIFSPNGNYFQLLIFSKYSQFQTVVQKYKENNRFNEKLNLVFQVVVLFTEIIQICHFICCGWYLIGIYNRDNLNNISWLSDFKKDDIQSLYISSFYYCVITITTIGYGDISAKNNGERIFASFTALTASGFFGYTVSRMSSILDEYYKLSNQFRMQLTDINFYMDQRQVSSQIQDRARNYLEYVYKEGYVNNEKINLSLNSLSKSIKQAIEGDVYYRTLSKFDLFGNQLSKAFLQRIALKVKEMNFAPDEDIVKRGKLETPIMYFIQRGEVEIFSDSIQEKQNREDSVKSFCILQKDSQFGVDEFLMKNNYSTYSARSKGLTNIQCISCADFYEVIQEFPRDHEIMMNIKDHILLHRSYQDAHLFCFSCKSSRHLVDECPFVQFVPNKQKLYNNLIKKDKQFAQQFLRVAKKLKFNACKEQQQVEKSVLLYLEQNLMIEWISDNEDEKQNQEQNKNDDIERPKSNISIENKYYLILFLFNKFFFFQEIYSCSNPFQLINFKFKLFNLIRSSDEKTERLRFERKVQTVLMNENKKAGYSLKNIQNQQQNSQKDLKSCQDQNILPLGLINSKSQELVFTKLNENEASQQIPEIVDGQNRLNGMLEDNLHIQGKISKKRIKIVSSKIDFANIKLKKNENSLKQLTEQDAYQQITKPKDNILIKDDSPNNQQQLQLDDQIALKKDWSNLNIGSDRLLQIKNMINYMKVNNNIDTTQHEINSNLFAYHNPNLMNDSHKKNSQTAQCQLQLEMQKEQSVGFEVMHEYQLYFPHNNFSNVSLQINQSKQNSALKISRRYIAIKKERLHKQSIHQRMKKPSASWLKTK